MADFAACLAFVLRDEDDTPPRYATERDPVWCRPNPTSDPAIAVDNVKRAAALAISGVNSYFHPDAFEDIFALPPAQRGPAVTGFYESTYFTGYLAQLSDPVAMRVMDAEVNEGPGTGIMLLQRACNSLGAKLAVDGGLGQLTVAAANALDQSDLVAAFKAARVAAYKAIGGPNLQSWLARANK